MPRNRQQIPREERAGEILTAATEVFLKHGYDGTTIADISSAAGVARANVYWYFPSKDDVFAAVMDRMLTREARALDHELAGIDSLSALNRALAEMRRFRGLHRSMHHRMEESQAVREAHDRFMTWIRSKVEDVVEHSSTPVDKVIVGDVFVTLFEGAHVSEPPVRPLVDMVRFLLQALVPEAEGPDIKRN